jgi:hypothetical protein
MKRLRSGSLNEMIELCKHSRLFNISWLRNRICPEPHFREPRLWSNKKLRMYAKHEGGIVINLSAGDDCDKDGDLYRNYFTSCESYSTTNYSLGSYRGLRDDDSYECNLEEDDNKLVASGLKADLIFCHTVLEHIYNVEAAFKTISNLSRESVVIIVPFSQTYHPSNSFDDFWRFTPAILVRKFRELGFNSFYHDCNYKSSKSIYVYFHARRTAKFDFGIYYCS